MIAPVDQVLFAPMVDRLKLVALPDPGISTCSVYIYIMYCASSQRGWSDTAAERDARCKMQDASFSSSGLFSYRHAVAAFS